MANKGRKDSADDMMEFQERMARNKHQYEVADLRAAGLNPILSATSGMGSGSPSGAMYTPENYLGQAVSSGVEAYRAEKEAEKKDQEIENLKEEIKKMRTDMNKTVSEATKIDLEAANVPIVGKNIEQQTATAKASEDLLRVDAAVQNMYGHKLAQDANTSRQMERLLKQQGVSEALRSQLLNLDLPVAIAHAKKAVVDGKITDTAFGEYMAFVRRFSESVGMSSHLRVPTGK